MNTTLYLNCYARVKATGQVGRINAIYPATSEKPRTFGFYFGDEYTAGELERILPSMYHATPEHLRLPCGS